MESTFCVIIYIIFFFLCGVQTLESFLGDFQVKMLTRISADFCGVKILENLVGCFQD